MKLYTGEHIGQSGSELLIAVFFSFFLHAALVALTLILVTAAAPKVHIPLFYEVKLVGQPTEIAPAPSTAQPSPVQKEEPAPPVKKTQPKLKIAAPKPVTAAPKKDDMPELSTQKSKPTQRDELKSSASEQANHAPKETASAPNVSASTPPKGISATGGVEVKQSSGDPRIAAYIPLITRKIHGSWHPREGSKDRKVTVFFKVNRTGRVVEVKIQDSNADVWFEREAESAIWNSSPIPMPDDYYKDVDFTVALMPKE